MSEALLNLAGAVVTEPAILYLAAFLAFLFLAIKIMIAAFEACSHNGARDEVQRLRRDYVERRLADRRNPEKAGSPSPSPERRQGPRRRRDKR